MKITLFAVRSGNKVYEFSAPVSIKVFYSQKRWIAHADILPTLSTWTFAPKKKKILPSFFKQIALLIKKFNKKSHIHSEFDLQNGRELLKLITVREIA